ncbi:tRNA (guanosine(46)-N7)-methyltransferase TrmB [bacterium]|nr:tRNA (guanosine(46)-N7)-methyltransferase TrmB [bacterium]
MRQAGMLVERMKKGEAAPDKHFNPYLHEALEYQNILLTGGEWAERKTSCFADSSKPLLIEVGCYMGKNVLEFAEHNPEWNILGIDITYKRTVKAARKIKSLGMENAKIVISDARQALAELPAGSLAGLCVFFPDPWPKKKQRKNRLLQEHFFEILKEKLNPNGGFFWFKTDSEDYFLCVQETLRQLKWSESESDARPNGLEPLPYTTVFEALFIGKNLPIYRRVYQPQRANVEESPQR